MQCPSCGRIYGICSCTWDDMFYAMKRQRERDRAKRAAAEEERKEKKRTCES